MRRVYYNKLIRDGVPEIIIQNGEKPIVKKLSKRAFQAALKDKLVEEAQEAASTKTRAELIEELADVQEVLQGIYEVYDIACGEVTNLARKKRKARGGFTKQLFLEDVK